ncbi:exopolyphosphatase [Colwelliaceae bacterium 6471]
MSDNAEDNSAIPENYLAALDIGSNSFHFVFARLHENNVQILHTEKYRVKLADGLNANNKLSKQAIARGIRTLTNLAATTQNLTPDNFRVVATYTLRQATNAQEFLLAAAKVFPFKIEIVSGHEEARLIYQGVAHYSEPTKKQLVIDIGGGSTECVIGQREEISALASLNMGCVSYQQQFFAKRKINEKYFERAILSAKRELESIENRFKRSGWQAVTGTSGTIKSIHRIINANNQIPQPITLSQLHALKEVLLKFEHFDDININTLKENRRDVLCSGLAITIALVEMLDIKAINFCEYALREGVLYEQLDILHANNIKQLTVDNLTKRFAIDICQADKVKQLALSFYDRIQHSWGLNKKHYRDLLSWSAQLHELGVEINPSGYHRHGEYIIANADLAGFTQEYQYALAWLIGNQRKKISSPIAYQWYVLDIEPLSKICALLRLAILLCQQRQLSLLPSYQISASEKQLNLVFPKQWLIERPLVKVDLFHEQQVLKILDIKLMIANK